MGWCQSAPTTRELVRMLGSIIGIHCSSYPTTRAAVTLDIHNTCEVVHGYQQLSPQYEALKVETANVSSGKIRR